MLAVVDYTEIVMINHNFVTGHGSFFVIKHTGVLSR